MTEEYSFGSYLDEVTQPVYEPDEDTKPTPGKQYVKYLSDTSPSTYAHDEDDYMPVESTKFKSGLGKPYTPLPQKDTHVAFKSSSGFKYKKGHDSAKMSKEEFLKELGDEIIGTHTLNPTRLASIAKKLVGSGLDSLTAQDKHDLILNVLVAAASEDKPELDLSAVEKMVKNGFGGKTTIGNTAEVEEMRSRLNKATEQWTVWHDKANELTRQVAQLERDARTRSVAPDNSAEIRRLQTELATAENDKKYWKEQSDTLAARVDTLNNQLNTTITNTNNDLARQLQAQITELQRNLDAEKEKVDLANKEIAKWYAEYEDTFKRLGLVAKEVSDLRTSYENAQKTITQKTTLVEYLTGQLRTKNDRVVELENRLGAAEQSGDTNKTLLAQLDQKNRQATSLAEQLGSVNQELATVKQEAENLNRQLRSAMDDLNNVKSENQGREANLRQQITGLESDLNIARSTGTTNQDLANSLQEKEGTIRTLNARLEQAKTAATDHIRKMGAEHTEKVNGLSEKINELTRDLEESRAAEAQHYDSAANNQNTINSMQKQITELQNENGRLREQIERSSRDAADAAKKIQDLQKQLSKKEAPAPKPTPQQFPWQQTVKTEPRATAPVISPIFNQMPGSILETPFSTPQSSSPFAPIQNTPAFSTPTYQTPTAQNPPPSARPTPVYQPIPSTKQTPATTVPATPSVPKSPAPSSTRPEPVYQQPIPSTKQTPVTTAPKSPARETPPPSTRPTPAPTTPIGSTLRKIEVDRNAVETAKKAVLAYVLMLVGLKQGNTAKTVYNQKEAKDLFDPFDRDETNFVEESLIKSTKDIYGLALGDISGVFATDKAVTDFTKDFNATMDNKNAKRPQNSIATGLEEIKGNLYGQYNTENKKTYDKIFKESVFAKCVYGLMYLMLATQGNGVILNSEEQSLDYAKKDPENQEYEDPLFASGKYTKIENSTEDDVLLPRFYRVGVFNSNPVIVKKWEPVDEEE